MRIILLLLICLAFLGCEKDETTSPLTETGPTISSIQPSSALPGQKGVRVKVFGANFTGPVEVSFGPATQVTKATLKSSTEIVVIFDIQDNAPSGFQTVRIKTSQGDASSGNLFQIQANRAPEARFTASAEHIYINNDIFFDASESQDPDGTIASYDWDFGDGVTANGLTTQHSYANAGDYTVSLTVTDNLQAASVEQQNVFVEKGNSPVAHLNISSSSGNTSTIFVMSGATSTDSDGRIVLYQWDFGDGGTAEGMNASHQYATSGNFTVRLTVTDDEGLQDYVEKVVEVTGAAPVASFTVTPSVGEVGTSFHFDGSASSDADGTIAEYQWFFGDGTNLTGPVVDHSFATAGSHLVQLTVVDNSGLTAQQQQFVNVSTPGSGTPPPVAGTSCTNPVARRTAAIFGTLLDYDEASLTSTVQFYDPHTCDTAWFDCGDLRKTTPERFYGIMRGMEYLGNNTFRIKTECPVTWPPKQIGEEIVIVWRKCAENHCVN